jgi:GLPGLI family protein
MPHGPSEFNGLPGIILEVQSADFHILAQQVTGEKAEISIPTDGEKITREDFNKLREEKIKERQEMWGDRRRR